MSYPPLTIAQTNVIKNTLLKAAADGETKFLQAMVIFGANPNYSDDTGCTVVCMAAAHGHTETVRALVELGADVNTADNTGCTPLHVAVRHDSARNDNAAMIWTLVRGGGANAASLNHAGKRARDLARPGSSADKVLQWLEEDARKDASYKTPNDYNRTKETDCPVCLEELKGDAIVLVPCGHRACPGCWADMRAKHEDKCPLCRAPIAHGMPQNLWRDEHPLYSRFCVEVPRASTAPGVDWQLARPRASQVARPL